MLEGECGLRTLEVFEGLRSLLDFGIEDADEFLLLATQHTDEVRLRRCAKMLCSIDTPESKELLRKIEAWLP